MCCCTCEVRAVSGHGKAGAQNESAEKDGGFTFDSRGVYVKKNIKNNNVSPGAGIGGASRGGTSGICG